MRIETIKPRDVLVSTDKHGTGYYYVLKVNRVTVDVWAEQGHTSRMLAATFDRKVSDHPHFWFTPKWGGCEQCRVCSTPKLGADNECVGPVAFELINGFEQMEG